MAHWCKDADKGNVSTKRKTWLIANLSTKNLTRTGLVSKPCLYGDRTVAKSLGQGKAFLKTKINMNYI